MERTGVVTFQGNPLTLVGPALKTGDAAPGFTAVNGGLAPVSLSDFSGKTVLLSVVPSLDTPVCELQTVRFQAEAAKLRENVAVVTISMDLPFAQARFCSAHGADKIIVLSDYMTAAFGEAYGVLIKELRLLTRAIFVIGADGKIAYVEIVPEVTNHPDYDKALAAVKAAG